MTDSFFASLRSRRDPSNDADALAWMTARQRGPIPGRVRTESLPQLKEVFTTYARVAEATLSTVQASADVPTHITAILKQENLVGPIDAMPCPYLTAMDWSGSGLAPHFGAARDRASVGIILPYRAVAETGSLVMVSGPATPNLMNFLPEHVIAVLPFSLLRRTMEDVWVDLRHDYGHTLPRSIVFVTGPSRSADIEQTLQIGAHGPCQLHIVMVDDATA